MRIMVEVYLGTLSVVSGRGFMTSLGATSRSTHSFLLLERASRTSRESFAHGSKSWLPRVTCKMLLDTLQKSLDQCSLKASKLSSVAPQRRLLFNLHSTEACSSGCYHIANLEDYCIHVFAIWKCRNCSPPEVSNEGPTIQTINVEQLDATLLEHPVSTGMFDPEENNERF